MLKKLPPKVDTLCNIETADAWNNALQSNSRCRTASSRVDDDDIACIRMYRTFTHC